MLLADSHITMVVGVDVHVTTAPPFNPIHPYIGMVLDVADYILFLGTNVSVNGLKRGVSDTGGMIIPLMHIPLAGPFAMASMIGHESMNFFAVADGVLRRQPHESEGLHGVTMLRNTVSPVYPKIANFANY